MSEQSTWGGEITLSLETACRFFLQRLCRLPTLGYITIALLIVQLGKRLLNLIAHWGIDTSVDGRPGDIVKLEMLNPKRIINAMRKGL